MSVEGLLYPRYGVTKLCIGGRGGRELLICMSSRKRIMPEGLRRGVRKFSLAVICYLKYS